MRVAVTQALLIAIGAGCAPTPSGYPVVPVAMRPKAEPIPLAKAEVLAEVYGQLLALLRPCPALRPVGQRFRRQVVSNAGTGRTVEDTQRIISAMDRAIARETRRWSVRMPPEVCARTGRLLAATQANENENVSALAGMW